MVTKPGWGYVYSTSQLYKSWQKRVSAQIGGSFAVETGFCKGSWTIHPSVRSPKKIESDTPESLHLIGGTLKNFRCQHASSTRLEGYY